MADYPLPAHLACQALVLGVGNRLFGDDGFGPRLLDRLQAEDLGEGVCLIDAGTGASGLLFDVAVSDKHPTLLLLLDAIDLPDEHAPGEVFELAPEELPANKRDDFSMHQLPGSNLLAELEASGCAVRIVGCQVKDVPEEMREGLSPEVEAALGPGAELAREILRRFLAA